MTAGRDVRRHAPDFVLRELIAGDWTTELLAVERVVARLLECRLTNARCAAPGLQAPGRETAHLEVEAPADACLPTDKVFFRHEVVVYRQRERVHAAIAGSGVRGPGNRSALGLGMYEMVPGVRLLRNDEERESPVAERTVGVRAGQQGENVCSSGEGRPRLRPVDEPPFAAPVLARRRPAGHRCYIRADVRFRYRNTDQRIAGGDARQPVLSLLFAASLDESAGQDFGARDQATGDERRGGKFLSEDDHRQVTHLRAAVRLRDRAPEEAETGHFLDQAFRH